MWPVKIKKLAWNALFSLATLSLLVPVMVARSLPASTTADKVLVLKAKRKLLLLHGGGP